MRAEPNNGLLLPPIRGLMPPLAHVRSEPTFNSAQMLAKSSHNHREGLSLQNCDVDTSPTCWRNGNWNGCSLSAQRVLWRNVTGGFG